MVAPQLIDGLVHEGDDMKPVENNFYVGQYFMDGPEVGVAHVHCHCFKLFPSFAQGLQKGPDVLIAFSFDRVQ